MTDAAYLWVRYRRIVFAVLLVGLVALWLTGSDRPDF
jgi:hypothetical protein